MYSLLHALRTLFFGCGSPLSCAVFVYLAVFFFSPLLKRTGYGLTWEEGCVLVWGGLRGAVGLALALIVEQDNTLDRVVRDRILFHVAGIAGLTLLINGTTCGWLVDKLGLTKVSTQEQRLYDMACHRLEEYTADVRLPMLYLHFASSLVGLLSSRGPLLRPLFVILCSWPSGVSVGGGSEE